MDIIKPQSEYVTNSNHIKTLYILKKCMENSINKMHIVSKTHYKKNNITSTSNIDRLTEEKKILEKIINSIDFYSKTIS